MKKKDCMVVYDFSEIGGVNAVITELMNELVEYYNISLLSIIDTKKKAYNLNENINYKTILSHKTSLRREAIHVRKPGYCPRIIITSNFSFLKYSFAGFLT